jgi:putative (di)nucleoside polyphosphate hydrolase
MSDGHLYRRGVGVMLLNSEGKVWVGARIDNSADAWQMPQGGIDEGEEPWATALRELEEETGNPADLVERIACCPEP